MIKKNRKVNNLRKTIRLLQSIPIVLSVVVVFGFLLDTYDIGVMWYACPMFGFSIYTMSMLYVIGRRLYVSRWSRILYLNLVLISTVDFFDSIFKFSEKFATFQELVFSIFIAVVVSSLCTFIYDKFKHGF